MIKDGHVMIEYTDTEDITVDPLTEALFIKTF